MYQKVVATLLLPFSRVIFIFFVCFSFKKYNRSLTVQLKWYDIEK